MTPAFSKLPALSAWPFWVLELTPSSSQQDVEKACREITGKLTLNMSGADSFTTPNGIMCRDSYLVREARAMLIDPDRRLLAEFWYVPPTKPSANLDERKTPTASQWRSYFGVN